jgi:hypothetical protein
MTSIKRTRIIGVLIVLGTSAIVSAGDSVAPYQPYIPEDKGLDPEWIASLSLRGEQRVYQGDELDLIGMPCGGIGAGQLEISGNVTLVTSGAAPARVRWPRYTSRTVGCGWRH